MTGYNQSTGASDPFEFVRNLWGGAGFPLPGMVTPTLDADELGKRISEMRSVENWLRMNLNMLQMTIQGLEMQQATLNAVRAMGDSYQQQTMKNAEAAAASKEKTEKAEKSAAAANSKAGAGAGAAAAESVPNPFANMAAAASAAASMWPRKLMDSGTAAAKSAEA
ncbi:MAG: hypothetical protein IKU14_00700, partial [Rhodocyclaceae bacterium]|nr:hypothetical protein [Rhodocyclaceae bacterium]